MSFHDLHDPSRPSAGHRDPAARPSGAADAVGFLFSKGADSRRESRRVTFGLFALAILCVVLLNFGIYQNSLRQLTARGWQQLGTNTDVKRDQIRNLLWHFQRQARFMAEQPDMAAWAQHALNGTLSAADRTALDQELRRALETFDLHHLVLVTPEGAVLARALEDEEDAPEGRSDLARRASQARETVVGDIRADDLGHRTLDIAAPILTPHQTGRVPVLLSGVRADAALNPLLDAGLSFGSAGHAYLVRQEGSEVLFLSVPTAAGKSTLIKRLPISSRDARAAVMAAAGVESNVEATDLEGHAIWAVTRYLPEVDWGLVGQVDRSAVLIGTRSTVAKLLVLDLALAVACGCLAWVLRRQFQRGLARHELEVTQRHAARVQAIFDTAFDAILTFDHTGRVRSVNRAAEYLFDRTAMDMEGQPLQRLLHWNASGYRAAGEVPTTGTVAVAEAMRANGEVFPVEFSLGQAGEGDELLYTAIVRDISERVDAEKRIRAFAHGLEVSNRRLEELNAQLEEASRLKSEFLANTSHELRTPLNGMIGFLQLVLDGMCESPDEEREFLGQALQCSRHLLGLINDVLDIAKIEAGKLELDIGRVDLQALLDEVQTVTHVQAAQRRIGLKFEVEDTGRHAARADFAKTKQILINLVGNGLKFTPRGSILVRAVARPALGHVLFEVIDTGIGIPRDRQSVIFDKFTQADGSTTRKYGGTGLGLAISRSLVELMGGIIGVESEGEGKGTRMYFSLPLWAESVELPTTTDLREDGAPVEGPADGALILVVEDDPAFRQFLRVLLHQHGYRTVEANHAEAGWALARQLRPAVVILDYALSCAEGAELRTGWDLAERMTAEAETRHIPVIFVTGFDEELRRKLKATAFARQPEHVVKPIEGAALVAKIEELVGVGAGQRIRVLMADDDPAIAAYVRKVLPQSRFQLDVATNGEECMHLLRTRPRGFDLLLLDLMMPDVSGYDVLREMALVGTAADLPVLVLTNFPEARNEEERRLLDQGLVLDVVPKTTVHENPHVLAHIVDWHVQTARERSDEGRAA
jgi:PAS domain S-box-containing protein